MLFRNRTAVITGAAGRIGRATSLALGKQGVKLYLADIKLDALQEFVKELAAENIDATAVMMDVTSLESIRNAAEEILRSAGKVDILVNNAGSWPQKSLIDTDDELWNFSLELNLSSVFRVTKAFLPSMLEQQYGRIINIGSIAGICGLPGYFAYSTCKAGVQMMTKVMAMELAKKGITVNSVSPGLISDEVKETTGTWIGKTGTGADIARAIIYLASDNSSFVTGSDMAVDGARTAGPLNPTFKG